MDKISFSELISPLTEKEFFFEYLNQKPLVIHRSDSAYYSEVLNLDMVDHVLTNHSELGSYDMKIALAKTLIFDEHYANTSSFENIKIKTSIAPKKVKRLMEEKRASLVIDKIQNIWPSVRRLAAMMEQAFSSPAGTNLYITPKAAQGFDPHFDAHDVFVVQVYGRKLWKIYNQAEKFPQPKNSNVTFDTDGVTPEYEVMLEQGDLIYIPAGFVHEALTADDVGSMHIALGISHVTWENMLQKFVRFLAKDSELLRAGFFTQQLSGRENMEDTLQQLMTLICGKLTEENMQKLGDRSRLGPQDVVPLQEILEANTPLV